MARGVEHLGDPETIRNPYPLYDALRDRSPLFGYRDFPPGTIPGIDTPEPAWAVLKFEDVAEVARNHVAFASRDSVQERSTAPTLMLVNHDGDQHTRLRKIAAAAFLPSAIRGLEPHLAELTSKAVDDFVGAFPEGDSVDVASGLCAILPSRVMAHLLGVDADRDQDIRRWSTAFMLSVDVPPQERQRCNQEIMSFFDAHVRRVQAARPACDGGHGALLNAFIDAEVDGERLTFEEIVRFAMTVTVAGAETTSFLLGNMLAVFADEPGVWQSYREDASLIGDILNETMRLHGPPQRLFRVATRDIGIGSARIAKGDWVACFFGAANHDPAMFPEPATFRLQRPHVNRQMSFGYGIHRCLGAPLARLEAELLAAELARRYRHLDRAGTAVWQGVSLLNHGLECNPIAFRSA